MNKLIKLPVFANFKLLTAVLCAVVLLYPFNQFYWHYGWETNIPYADLLIMLAGLLWLFSLVKNVVLDRRHYKLSRQVKINIALFFVLMAAGCLSLLNVWPEQLGASLKYLFRFVAFYYIFYFLLIQLLANNEKRYWLISWCLYILGVFLSLMGVIAFFWPELPQAFHMAGPLSWFGLFPYGSSHNLLAEALVSIILFSWLLAYRYQSKKIAKWLYLGLAGMVGVCLLTFSRTGWLVLWIELFLLAVIYYRSFIIHIIRKYWWTGLVVVALIMIYFITLGQTYFVTSSNAARVAMIEKSWHMFLDRPWLGNGIGTWQEIVSKDIYYVYEFGQPLEQHGIFWKLMAEQGVLGLCVWFGVILYFIIILSRNYLGFAEDNPWRWGALIALLIVVGQTIFQLLDTGYYSAKMWLPFGLAFALMYISQKHLDIEKSK